MYHLKKPHARLVIPVPLFENLGHDEVDISFNWQTNIEKVLYNILQYIHLYFMNMSLILQRLKWAAVYDK